MSSAFIIPYSARDCPRSLNTLVFMRSSWMGGPSTSFNMLARMAQHYAGIQMQAERKYRVLAEATRHGHKMCFTVLYTAKASSHAAIEEEIGQKEGELIRQHLPPLNT